MLDHNSHLEEFVWFWLSCIKVMMTVADSGVAFLGRYLLEFELRTLYRK